MAVPKKVFFRYLTVFVFCFGALMGLFILDCSFQRPDEERSISCSNEESLSFISNLCYNYSQGLVTGSMCRPLCITKEFNFIKCIGHKRDDFVLLASHKSGKRTGGRKRKRAKDETLVIFKADVSLGQTLRFHFHQKETSEEGLSRPYHQNTTQMKYFMNKLFNVSNQTANWIISECDYKKDGHLTNREAAYCWHMVDEEEILLGLSYQNYSIAPKVFGVCGNLFVTEYIPTLPLLTPITRDRRSWDLRARLSLGLIELVERIDLIPNRNLLLCDVQESNFGVIKINANSQSYTVMSIDNDLSIFERDLVKSLRFESNVSCTSNDDCSFIHCVVKCDQKRGKCSGEILSNNLQLICQRFFKSRHHYLHLYPLLHDPPKHISKELYTLIHECVHPLVPSTQISKRLVRNFKKLLQSTLTNNNHEML